MRSAYELRRAAAAFFMPNRCPFCDEIIGAYEYWCEECYTMLPFMNGACEPVSGLEDLRACCLYTGAARDAVLRMKDGFYRYAPDAFAVLMTELVGDVLPKVDFVTSVPAGLSRRMALGYAHCEMIAKDIARRGRKPFYRTLGVTRFKGEQKKLSRSERMENAGHSYRIVREKHISGSRILLVDDVCTTGATLGAAAGLLKSAGALEVYGAVFAQTPLVR